MITKEILSKVYPKVKNASIYVPILNEMFQKHSMTAPYEQEMFIAQLLHESAGFQFVKEIWGPTRWQKLYEGHKGLGNTRPGDGRFFSGRGLIQLTGRANYQLFANWVGDQLIMIHPEIVERPRYAVESAIWFWKKNKLKRFSDANDIVGCTRVVNGKKMLGLEERTHFYESLKAEYAKD
jgi:putative chitinase